MKAPTWILIDRASASEDAESSLGAGDSSAIGEGMESAALAGSGELEAGSGSGALSGGIISTRTLAIPGPSMPI